MTSEENIEPEHEIEVEPDESHDYVPFEQRQGRADHQDRIDHDDEADDKDHEDEDSEGLGIGSFAVIAVALIVLAGGIVYFFGSVAASGAETANAQSDAEEQLRGFDSGEILSEFDLSTPDSLPLVDDATSPTVVPSEDAPTEVSPSTTQPPTTQPPAPTTTVPFPQVDPADVALAFVNRVPGEDYAQIGYLDRDGERHVLPQDCVRLDWNVNGGVCLNADLNALAGNGFLLNSGFVPQGRFNIGGPSRAAVSPDGAVVSWTGFTLGHSYLEPGEFATTTQLVSIEREVGANLETVFDTFDFDGDAYMPEDRNYWGVTFIDADRFYATLGTENGEVIVEGNVQTRRLDFAHSNASCPEVSPDGSTIVAKERRGDGFQLVAIDTESGTRRDLGETRSVDDQVEWLNDTTIAYGLPNLEEGTSAQPAFDIWALDVAPGSEPRLAVPFADSPAAP